MNTLSLLSFLLFFAASYNSETVEVRDAMVQFMQKLSPAPHPPRNPNWGWNSTSDPCFDNWEGITCHTDSPTIKKIMLDAQDLTGILDAASLCVTRELHLLSLNWNSVSGILPEEISDCSHLIHLYLRGNNFSGILPKSLLKLSGLKRIDISDNGFSGPIPDLSQVSGLLTFRAENNSFSGALPEMKVSSLVEFNVSYNNLSGPIPDAYRGFGFRSFIGNPGLCGDPLPNACAVVENRRKRWKPLYNYVMFCGYGALVIVILCAIGFIVIKKFQGKKKSATLLEVQGSDVH